MKKGLELKNIGLSSEVIKQIKIKNEDIFQEYVEDEDTIVIKRVSIKDIREKSIKVFEGLENLEDEKINSKIYEMLCNLEKEISNLNQKEDKMMEQDIKTSIYDILLKKYDNVVIANKLEQTEMHEYCDFITTDYLSNKVGFIILSTDSSDCSNLTNKEVEWFNLFNRLNNSGEAEIFHIITKNDDTRHCLQQLLFKWIRSRNGQVRMLQKSESYLANLVIHTSTLECFKKGEYQTFSYIKEKDFKKFKN